MKKTAIFIVYVLFYTMIAFVFGIMDMSCVFNGCTMVQYSAWCTSLAMNWYFIVSASVVVGIFIGTWNYVDWRKVDATVSRIKDREKCLNNFDEYINDLDKYIDELKNEKH